MQMWSKQLAGFIIILIIIFTAPLVTVSELAAMPGSVDYQSLEKQVASLRLGFGEYHIANKLNQNQKEKAQHSLLKKSYPGTYTFVDGELFIVVEKGRDTIIAVYRKNEKSGKKELKQMIADLMSRFENPTSEAHDQIIYWAYDEKGKISDSRYQEMKQEGESDIIATVKFKSKLTFTEIDGENDGENSIHCIVSSPRLLEKIYQQ